MVLLLGGILGYVFRDQVEESMRQQMHDTMIRDYGFVKMVDDAWNALQQTVKIKNKLIHSFCEYRLRVIQLTGKTTNQIIMWL